MQVQLGARHIFSLSVDCAPAIELGETDAGYAFVIPITGGSFAGDGLGDGIRGVVLPGGADYNTRYGRSPQEVDASHVDADYLIQTDDGSVIHVRNTGWKDWRSGRQTRIVTNPRFQVGKGSYEWLNYGVYVGTLTPRPDKTGVELEIFRMD